MDGLCANTTKSSKPIVGRAVNKQWMNRMSTSYCLFGNTTCPFKYPNKKKEWWLQSCYAPECKPTAICMLLLLPKLPTRNKDKPFSPLKLNSSLHTKTVQQLLTSGQQTKAAASKQFETDMQTRDRKRQLCKHLPVPLFKFPFDQRAHLGMGTPNHFKESSLLWWVFWGHGPRQVKG